MSDAPLPHPIAEQVAQFPGHIHLAAADLDRPWAVAFHATAAVPSASVIKLLIVAELYRQAANGILRLDEPCPVERTHWVEGSGVLRWLRPNLVLTLRDLAVLAIIVSDNTASNRLIDRLGFTAINRLAEQLGLQQTALRRPFWGRAARPDEPENTMSAGDAVALLSALERGTVVPEGPLLDDIRTILRAQQHRDLIPARLPTTSTIGNKTGGLPGLAHDAALIWAPHGRLALALFATDLTDEARGKCALRNLAKACYDLWESTSMPNGSLERERR